MARSRRATHEVGTPAAGGGAVSGDARRADPPGAPGRRASPFAGSRRGRTSRRASSRRSSWGGRRPPWPRSGRSRPSSGSRSETSSTTARAVVLVGRSGAEPRSAGEVAEGDHARRRHSLGAAHSRPGRRDRVHLHRLPGRVRVVPTRCPLAPRWPRVRIRHQRHARRADRLRPPPRAHERFGELRVVEAAPPVRGRGRGGGRGLGRPQPPRRPRRAGPPLISGPAAWRPALCRAG